MTECLEHATNIVAGTIQQGFNELSTTVHEKLKFKIAIKKEEVVNRHEVAGTIQQGIVTSYHEIL